MFSRKTYIPVALAAIFGIIFKSVRYKTKKALKSGNRKAKRYWFFANKRSGSFMSRLGRNFKNVLKWELPAK